MSIQLYINVFISSRSESPSQVFFTILTWLIALYSSHQTWGIASYVPGIW